MGSDAMLMLSSSHVMTSIETCDFGKYVASLQCALVRSFPHQPPQIESTADHADVAERLGVVAQVCAGRWIDLFGEEAVRPGPRAEAIVEFERLVEEHWEGNV